jgi:chorismate synthase
MKNVLGQEITLTLFGESHGPGVGCVLDGLPSGFPIDLSRLETMMAHRRAAGSLSTGRHEADAVVFVSGLRNGVTEGTPLTMWIRNEDVHSADYDSLKDLARPGHADYTAQCRYLGYQDARGGGHFSGRLTAPVVAAGAVVTQMLEARGIRIGTHIARLHGISDRPFDPAHLERDIAQLNALGFAVLDPAAGEKMKKEIEEAKAHQDSVGGILTTAVAGLEAGLGEPYFESVEARLSAALFAVPALKGVAFGEGFGFAELTGSQANDAFAMAGEKVVTRTNHNGGINGGITNGMPVVFSTVIKPTSSIAQKQETVNFKTRENCTIEIHGRHDPAIVHRARVVVDAVTALTLADMLASAHGRQWLGESCSMD